MTDFIIYPVVSRVIIPGCLRIQGQRVKSKASFMLMLK